MRDPLKFSPWDSVTPEAHCIPVIQVDLVMVLVELVELVELDQI